MWTYIMLYSVETHAHTHMHTHIKCMHTCISIYIYSSNTLDPCLSLYSLYMDQVLLGCTGSFLLYSLLPLTNSIQTHSCYCHTESFFFDIVKEKEIGKE